MTVAIIGIIGAIAIPSFQEHSAKGRRTDGQTLLLKTAQRMQTFYSENNTFTTDLANLGLGTTSVQGFYALSVAAPTEACPIASCYLLQAQPQGNHGADRCGVLTYGPVSGAGSANNESCW